jgi:hypothetical protein
MKYQSNSILMDSIRHLIEKNVFKIEFDIILKDQ